MRVLISISGRFEARGDQVYSHHLTYERFWARYLTVFDEVVVLARVAAADAVGERSPPATGPGVTFARVPQYLGPWQYLRRRGRIVKAVREAVDQCDAYLLRLPCAIGTLVWKNLPAGAPYGVEVVSDPWDGFAPISMKRLGRPFFRWSWTRNLKKQCAAAAVAGYVSQFALPGRYPPPADAFWTHYSSIALDDSQILADPADRLARVETIPQRLASGDEPVRIGYIGSFSQGHKLPDVHIKAVAKCVAQGANLQLDMIGGGGTLEQMRALAGELGVGDRVHFRGVLPGGKAIMEAIDTFDLFLCATACEGLPRVVIEAMARGCPSIGSDIGGIPELLDPTHLVIPAEVDSLAERISQVLADPAGMVASVERNIEVARRYTADQLEPRRTALYRELRERTERWRAGKTQT